jgi:hypothetical protein|nr:MAG TPA: tail tape measure [Caudoviricetes sp.]
MALEIFKLVGSIFVDNEQANNSIAKTDKNAQGVGQTLANGVKTAAKWGGAIVAGTSAAAAGCVKLVTDSAAVADNIDKMSQKIGLSKQGFQEWSYVMGQNGMDVDKLQIGIKTLVSKMESAAGGNKEAAATFKELGISIYDSSGKLKDQETMMNEAIYALADMENGTEKAALANALFGKSGSEMMPMLNQGSNGMKELTQRAHELGLVMSDEAVDAGVKLGDTIDDIKQAFSAIVTRMGSSLFPIIQKIADFIIEHLPQIEALFNKLTPSISQLMGGLLPPLMSLAEQIFPMLVDLITAVMPIVIQIVQEFLPVIIQLLQLLLPPLIKVVQQLLPPLLTILQPILDLLSPLLELLQPILDLIVGILEPIATLINGLLTPLINVIKKVIEVALVPLKVSFGNLSEMLKNTVKGAIDLIMSRIDMIKGVFSGLIQFIKGVFTGDWKSAWEGVKKIFASIWEGIKNVFKIPINWIVDGLNIFIRSLNKIKIPDWVPVVGGKGINIGEIPHLETGAVLEKGQTGLLEGNGAEAVVPLDKNKKWISAVARDMDTAMGGTGSKRVEALLMDILHAVDQLLGMGIYLDTGALVGGIVRPMDKKLGQLQLQKARG